MMGEFVICDVCGQRRDMASADTWFFLGGPMACKQVCSRGCLSRLVGELLRERPIAELPMPALNPSTHPGEIFSIVEPDKSGSGNPS